MPGSYLLSGQCLTACPSTFTNVNASICVKCQSPCLECTGSPSACTACAEGFFLSQSSQCVQTCSGLLIGYEGVCQPCAANCYMCVDSPASCYACEWQYKLLASSCVLSCPAGTYPSSTSSSASAYPNSTVCLDCPQQCQLCSSHTMCSLCSAGYVLHQNFCYTDCPPAYFARSAQISTVDTQVCWACQTGCIQCTNASACVACQAQMFLVEQTCISSCPNGNYPSGTLCYPCSTGCLSCSSAALCTQCGGSFSLSASQCV